METEHITFVTVAKKGIKLEFFYEGLMFSVFKKVTIHHQRSYLTLQEH